MSISMRQIIIFLIIMAGISAAQIVTFSQVAGVTETGATADQFDNTSTDPSYFFPAGYVFSTIWTVIYAGIGAFAVYQARPDKRDNERVTQAAYILAFNMFLNGLWVIIFGREQYLLSLLVIVVILITAYLTYLRLGIVKVDAPKIEQYIWIPLAMYAAWLTVATIANVTIVMIDMGITSPLGIDPVTWGAIMLIVAMVVGLAIGATLHDPVIPAVFAYAYIGVVVRYLDSAPMVAYAAIFGALVLLAFMGWQIYKIMSPPGDYRKLEPVAA